MDIKLKRNRLLVEYREKTGMSFEKLGRIFGMSRQAAHFIYHRDRNRYEKPQNQREALLKEEPVTNTGGTASLIPQWLIDWEIEQNY